MGPTLQEKDVIFAFDGGWEVEKFDEWPEHKALNRFPYHAKGCDFVAHDGRHLWLVEVKDYTRDARTAPPDLPQEVGVKAFHTLATIHAVARWGLDPHREFCTRALACTELSLCLSVELPDKGRKLMGVAKPLADLKDELARVTRPLGCHRPVVTAALLTSHTHARGVPWKAHRDPATRHRHHDR